jgi:hypothetical protein
MAKDKRQKKLYSKLRASGIRKRTARELSGAKPAREAVERLESIVIELKGHTARGGRRVPARKAARTRGRKMRPRARA